MTLLHKLEGLAQATRREWGQPYEDFYKEIEKLQARNRDLETALSKLVKETPFMPAPGGVTLHLPMEQLKEHQKLLTMI